MKAADLKNLVTIAIHSCQNKKAESIVILQMEKSASGFTDYFVICNGTNQRQNQAISDEVELQLKQVGAYPNNIEGFPQANWILLDYVDFVVHIFSEEQRKLYDLERLWKSAKRLTLDDLKGKATRVRSTPSKAVEKAKRAKPIKPVRTAAIARAVKAATSRKKPVTRKKAASAGKAKPKTGKRPSSKSRSKSKRRK